jgi:RHS repeat-associated protein
MKDGCKAFVWEARRDQTTYFGKESTRLINALSWEDNPQEKRGFILRSQASTDSGTETLSTEIRSRYTRRCVVRRQGREEARYTYDLMGRPTSEQRFVIKAGANRVEEDAEPVSAQTTEYSVLAETPEDTDAIINKGLQAITTRSDGHVIRTLTDGLQRAVRRELLAPGLAIGCVLDELECSGVQNVRNQTRYDYYPGGLRRRTENGARESLIAPPQASATEALKTGDPEKSGTVTAYLDAWHDELKRRSESPYEPAKPFLQTDDSTKNTTVETHLLAGREVFTRTLDEEVLASGGVRRIENQTTASGLKRPEVTREYDPVGNLIRMKRADVEQPMTMEYDELHRVTKVITPDGSVIAREYFGLSHQVTRLTVDEVVVGTQKVQAPSKLLERRVGERGYAYQSHAITLPDKQVLTTDASESGGTSLLLDANPLSTLSFDRPGKTTTVITHDAVNQDTPFWLGLLSEKMTLPGLSGNVQHQIKTPRATRSAWSTCSLMGRVLSARRTDGSLWRPFLDRDERTLRELHNGMDSLYHYGADGSMCRQETVAAQTGNRMSTEYRHDDFGQETFRGYELNGARALSIEQRWSDYGLLIGSTLSRDGKVLRSETFSHDSCDRLSTYRCTATEAADYPADAQDRPVKQQDFKWDGLQRLKSCATTFADDQTLNQAYDYDPLNPTRCLSIKGSSTEDPITLQWSVNGCMEQDAAGNRLRYNAQGQLLEVRDAQQHTLTRYAYDGHGRLAAQYVAASEETCELCYDGDSLCGEIWFDRDGKVLRQVMLGTDQFQQTVTSAGAPQIVFLMGSPHSGTIGCWRGGVVKDLSLSGFTPFGDQGNGLPECCKGYNDQRRDPVTGCYHLGNGYRTYNPSLRSFQQPDSLSPFDEGGINDYSYCCNPIDYHDPSGHIMLSRWHKDQMISNMEKTLRETRPQPVGKRWRGIAVSATLAAAGVLLSIPTGGASLAFFAATTALSVTALAWEIAAKFVEDSNPDLAKKLGIASMVTDSVTGVMSLGKLLPRLLRWGASAIGKIANKVREVRNYWNLVKFKGFKKAAQISKAAAIPAKQHEIGTIFQEIASEYTEYLGGGKTRVVRGWLARATNELPELFAHIRWLNHKVAPLMQPLAVGGLKMFLNRGKNAYESFSVSVTDLYWR